MLGQATWIPGNEAGEVVNACNASTWRLRQGDHEFKASLDYIARPDLMKKKKKKRF
jgi:hypothetical protein